METEFAAMKRLIEEVQADYDAFYAKGNKSAGTRVRKAMQEIKILAQSIRADVQRVKNEAE